MFLIRNLLNMEAYLCLCICLLQMLSSEFNPFTWDVSAQRVQSQVISLQLRNHQGSKIAISNLKRNIKITIPRTPSENATNSTQKFFIKPSVDGKMQFHSFVVEQQNTSAVVQVTQTIKLILFETINLNYFDIESYFPNLSQKHETNVKLKISSCWLIVLDLNPLSLISGLG